MLEIKGLYSGYGSLNVLNGIDLDVGENEIVALIGPNGAGKSTVIKSVFGFADVLSGKINFFDKDISGLEQYELLKSGIVYVNQEGIIFSSLTVEENLEIGRRFFNRREEFEKRVDEIYELFPSLRQKKKDLAFGLSGGERQMLAMGRALVSSPKLLMLDEPSLGLSPKLRSEIFDVLRKLREQGISVLIVEQNAKKAIELADRTYLLENGKIVLEGSGKNIRKHGRIKEVYLGGTY